MSTNTKESALEACSERHLTGGVSAMLSPGGAMSDDVEVYQTSKGAGWLRGKSTDFNSEFAIAENPRFPEVGGGKYHSSPRAA